MSQCKATLAVQILNDQEARFNSADLNIAYKMNVDEYQKLCPYSGELEANWGKAPGNCPAPHCCACLAAVTALPCAALRCAMLCYAAACNGRTVVLSLVKKPLWQMFWHAVMCTATPVSKQQSIQQTLLKQTCSAQLPGLRLRLVVQASSIPRVRIC